MMTFSELSLRKTPPVSRRGEGGKERGEKYRAKG
jgi:hypothetical protein